MQYMVFSKDINLTNLSKHCVNLKFKFKISLSSVKKELKAYTFTAQYISYINNLNLLHIYTHT